MSQYQVISSSAGQEFTGSIAKVIAIGPQTSSVLDRVEFGNLVFPETSFTASSVTGKVEIDNGFTIDGPIARTKTGADGDGGFLVYIYNSSN